MKKFSIERERRKNTATAIYHLRERVVISEWSIQFLTNLWNGSLVYCFLNGLVWLFFKGVGLLKLGMV
jgi:hypothetical protein